MTLGEGFSLSEGGEVQVVKASPLILSKKKKSSPSWMRKNST